MKNFILFLSLFIFLAFCTESKAQPYYYNSGIPTLFENWGNIPGGGGSHPSSFGENTEYIIESGKTAVLDFLWFIDNSATLRVNPGATLQINYSLNIGSNAKLILDSNATCIYNSTEIARNTIFGGTEDFHQYSTFKINNWSSVNDAITDSVKQHSYPHSYDLFGNLEINWVGCNGNWFLTNRSFALLCGNNLTITSTGAGKLVACRKNGTDQNALYTKNYIQTGGEIDLSFSSQSISYACVLRVHGNFNKSAGILDATDNQTIGAVIFTQNIYLPSLDTSTRSFYNSGTFRNVRIDIDNIKLKLLSNLDIPIYSSNTLSLQLTLSTIDFGEYKITGSAPYSIGGCTLKIRSAEGFKNGASGGNFVLSGMGQIYYGNTIEYCGSTPQLTGDSLPSYHPYINLKINNPNGVTLNKNLGLDTNNTLEFVSGKLNLGNFNLKVGTYDSIKGVNQNCFINTNGTGVVRVGLNGGYEAKFPIGNGTFSPAYINQAYIGNTDTIGIRVENGYGSHVPFDTSRCVRKLWRVYDENPSVQTSFRFLVQFMKSDAGSNLNYNTTCALGQYEPGYNGYHPWTGSMQEPFYTPPDSSISKTIYSSISISTSGDDYITAGNEEGLYEKYYPDNSGDASQLGNWTALNGLHPSSFDRYAIFSVPSGQIASFNSSVVFSDKTILRVEGNGVINGNQIVYLNGHFLLNDSSTFNYNNNGVLYDTYFAGRPILSEKSNVKILKWSDTTDKLFQNKPGFGYIRYGNLTINFNNLPNNIGGKWTTVKYPLGFYDVTPVRGNLTYIQSSGFEFSPIGFGNKFRRLEIAGSLQLGDSINFPDAYPTLNLSGGSTKAGDTLAGELVIGKNIDIQNGSIRSQDFPVIARGRIVLSSVSGNTFHTFYCYNPFLWSTYDLGSTAFPNIIDDSDTLVLKSDMYRSSQAAFLFTDAWQVNSGAVLNIDTFRIRSINLIIKNGGKIITKNREGLYADLANQTVTFEPSSILEYAGNAPQNYQKEGAYNLMNIPNVIINNPAGVTVNIPNTSITNSLTLLKGNLISSNANFITFTDNISFSNAGSNSFLSGPVRINTMSTNIKTIPLGKGGNYRGFVIIPTSANSTDWTIEYFNQQQPYGSTLGAGITSVSSAEYFLLNRSGSANATIGLSWGTNSGVTNPENLRVARWNDFQWEDKGNSGFIGDPSSGIVFSNMISEFSPFAIASIDNQQLPVELSLFNASSDRNNVMLNWVTETEVNNSGYEVERKSAADTNWKKVNFITGAGNSTTRKIYKYEDRNLPVGTYSYRLKQIDYNGNYTYYNLQSNVSVGIPNKFSLGQNYPNPFNPSTKINFELPNDAKVTIQIYDITGRLMQTLADNRTYQAGYHTIEMNGINLASGTYFYRIAAGDFIAAKKMQLVK